MRHDDSICTERLETEMDLARQVIREATNENDSSSFKEESIRTLTSEEKEDQNLEVEEESKSIDDTNQDSKRELLSVFA